MIIKKILGINHIYTNINCSSYIRRTIYKCRNHFAQEKNETSEIDNSSLITIPQIVESMETNNTSPQGEDKIPLIE
jgi:hypothetical protein